MSTIVVSLVLTVAFVLVTGQASDLVEVKWGVADSTAIVGKKFLLHVPSDAFSGSVKEIQVRTPDGARIPEWLDFDSKENVLTGLPTPKDVGQQFLELTASGPSNSVTTTFMLVVRDVPSHTSGAPLKFKKSGAEFVRCKRSEPETVATIILDVDVEVMKPSERISLLNKFLNHMELHEDMVKMVPVGKTSMHDDNALVSGFGDCTSPKTPGTFIAWPVGCGQVKSGHLHILQRMDDDSTSGKMSEILKQSVIGWHVVNSHIQAPKRKRRQVHVTATPVLTPSMPTMTATDVDSGEETFTRTVPGMSSPVIQPTTTQKEMPQTTTPTTTTEAPTEEDTTTPEPEPETEEPETKPEPTPEIPDTTHKETPKIEPTMTYTRESTIPVVTMDPCKGKKPKANGISQLKYNAGDIIDFVIPPNTFEDCEAGNTRGLSLSLKMRDGTDLPSGFFLQLDSKNQKLIGLPMQEHAKTYIFSLVAYKYSDGNMISEKQELRMRIKAPKNMRKVNHEISAIIDLDYHEFRADVAQQTLLATKIASIYGDSNADNLLITKLEPGSVIYGWANKSLNSNDCPVEGISDAVNSLVVDGKLSDEAVNKLKPFKLVGLSAQPAGQCEGNPNFPSVTIDNRPGKNVNPPYETPTTEDDIIAEPTTVKTDDIDTAGSPDETTTEEKDMGKEDSTIPEVEKDSTTEEDDEIETDGEPVVDSGDNTTPEAGAGTDNVASAGSGSDDDNVLLSTVAPAVIVVAMLLIALIIACVLYRKKRKGNLNVEEQSTFVNKGAPVIFPNELEDKPNDVTKPLLVEGGNGNAGPPPEYHRGDSAEPEGLNNHARNNTNNLNGLSDDDIHQYPQQYEPPTPPVTDTSSRHPGPAQQPVFSQPSQILP